MLTVVGCSGQPNSSADADDTTGSATIDAQVGQVASLEIAALPRSRPTYLRLPSLGVSSRLMSLGLADDGTLEVPPGAYPAGWFTGAPTPGELGPAVIAGHVSYNGTPGVFAKLGQLAVHDDIIVKRRDGTVADFEVTRVARFAKNHFPSALVYGNLDYPGLRLITCGGFNARTDTYQSNVVVFAVLT